MKIIIIYVKIKKYKYFKEKTRGPHPPRRKIYNTPLTPMAALITPSR